MASRSSLVRKVLFVFIRMLSNNCRRSKTYLHGVDLVKLNFAGVIVDSHETLVKFSGGSDILIRCQRVPFSEGTIPPLEVV